MIQVIQFIGMHFVLYTCVLAYVTRLHPMICFVINIRPRNLKERCSSGGNIIKNKFSEYGIPM